MPEKKRQLNRFNELELSLIKNTFAENEEIFKAIRKVFLQMPLNVIDTSLITSTFKGKKDLLKLMNKVFNPNLDEEAPLNQIIDLWMSVDTKERNIADLLPVFKARELLIKILEQQLTNLTIASEGGEMKIDIDIRNLTNLNHRSAEEFYVNLTARNTLITHVDAQLTQLMILAGKKDETPEELKERLVKDSTK